MWVSTYQCGVEHSCWEYVLHILRQQGEPSGDVLARSRLNIVNANSHCTRRWRAQSGQCQQRQCLSGAILAKYGDQFAALQGQL
jgi:hypothetical protein